MEKGAMVNEIHALVCLSIQYLLITLVIFRDATKTCFRPFNCVQ